MPHCPNNSLNRPINMHLDATLSQQQSESPHKKWILMPHCPKNKSESPHKNGMEQMQRHMSSFWAKYTV